MTKLCEGRVADRHRRGPGDRPGARPVSLARHGAKVVVNDLGGDIDGTGADRVAGPAGRRRDRRRMGGEAIANGDNVAELGRRRGA